MISSSSSNSAQQYNNCRASAIGDRRPEPRGTTHSAGIAMLRANNRRIDRIGKRIMSNKARKFVIQLCEIGKSAAEHNGVRIEYIDYCCQPTRQTAPIIVEALSSNCVTSFR